MFADDGCYLFNIVEHLCRRRQRTCDLDEPTGIIWHHKDQDDKSYAFLARLIEVVDQHKAATWCYPLADGPLPVAQQKRKAFRPSAAWFGSVWKPSRLRV